MLMSSVCVCVSVSVRARVCLCVGALACMLASVCACAYMPVSACVCYARTRAGRTFRYTNTVVHATTCTKRSYQVGLAKKIRRAP